MTITLKIDNPDTEERLQEFIKEQKEITLDVLSHFINTFVKKEPLEFKKKDPKKHSRIIKRAYNPQDVDTLALLHIDNSAEYIHNARREKR
ncbi:MAG: hypothetical protein Q9M36_11460 [Sulfurovum sp.]|nr:hypothetical protein [Sulfurovum sp.]